MTRIEHLEWCKTRAREYLDRGQPLQAMHSMLSDLKKHEENKTVAVHMTPMALLATHSVEEARDFIEGFM